MNFNKNQGFGSSRSGYDHGSIRRLVSLVTKNLILTLVDRSSNFIFDHSPIPRYIFFYVAIKIARYRQIRPVFDPVLYARNVILSKATLTIPNL